MRYIWKSACTYKEASFQSCTYPGGCIEVWFKGSTPEDIIEAVGKKLVFPVTEQPPIGDGRPADARFTV